MEKRVLLAFSGKMCTGKDTSANIWISRYCKYLNDINDPSTTTVRDYKRIAFADGIKDICKTIFGLSDYDVNDQCGKKRFLLDYGKTVREMMQGIGEGLRSNISKDIWVIQTVARVNKILHTMPHHILVTDVRYPNELEALKTRGFTMIKLVRDTGIHDNHPSERNLNDTLFDYVIDNNGTIKELEEKLLQIPEYTITNEE